MQSPVDSNFIDYRYEALATASYFMLINLFNGDFGMCTNVPQGADTLVAWFSQVHNPEWTLSKQILKLVEGVYPGADYVTT